MDIWWRSAAATHDFLSTPEIEALLPDVQALNLERLDTWVLCAPESEAVGFLVVDGSAVDALFIVPEWLRRGGGRLLMRKARECAGRLRADVNEQNAAAIQFYLAEGFEIVGRSPVDDAGRPYPLLHLEEPAMNEEPRRIDPLHGITLQAMIEHLVERYGWDGLGKRIDIRCFTQDPSVNSSLKFLRKTPWARDKVQSLYLHSVAHPRKGTAG